jgi:DNA polymerase
MEAVVSNGDTPHARMMMIGEQPGDREDREGHPFVGPAGRLLDQCLEEAGIDRKAVYVTNAVKHFKWESRGKLRIHKKPCSSEIFACRPWLNAEPETVRPGLIVCLGATAAQGLLGPRFKVTESHGTIQRASEKTGQPADDYPPIMATFHPASILRAQTEEDRHRQTEVFVSDLRKAEEFLHRAIEVGFDFDLPMGAPSKLCLGGVFAMVKSSGYATSGPGSSSKCIRLSCTGMV